jgi:hypothetical protein
MVEDRYQTRNIAAEHEEIVRECRESGREWLEEQKSKPGWRYDPYQAVVEERKAGDRK